MAFDIKLVKNFEDVKIKFRKSKKKFVLKKLHFHNKRIISEITLGKKTYYLYSNKKIK